ncbi:hypothetical protein CBS101457_004487 [Exobasidium rhododendri]|nr:hypothetical protein CBS101457_004487 [Exobasidium rhododendri]
MTDFEAHKRPALVPLRRASGPVANLDRSISIHIAERGNGVPKSINIATSTASNHHRGSTTGINQTASTLVRSVSTDAPASSDSSRPQSMRSESGSVETTAFGVETASTASPLITPGDDHPLYDPMLAATRRSLTAMPSVFDTTSKDSAGDKENNQELTDSVTFNAATENNDAMGERVKLEQKVGVIKREHSAGGNPATKATRNGIMPSAWQQDPVSTAISWTASFPITPALPSTSASAATTSAESARVARIAQREGQTGYFTEEHRPHSMEEGKKISMKDERTSFAPAHTSTLLPREGGFPHNFPEVHPQSHEQQQQYQLSNQLQQRSFVQQFPTLQQQQYFHPSPYYHPSIDTRSPELYPTVSHRNSMPANNAMNPMESNDFDAFRTTPDPYAPMYGLPPPPIASSSTSRSPIYHHHAHQSTDSSTYTYPPHAFPPPQQIMSSNMTGLPGHAIMVPRSNTMGSRPVGHQAPHTSTTAPTSSNLMMMQGVPHYPQSPSLVSVASPALHHPSSRSESHHPSMDGFHFPAGAPYGLATNQQWASSPTQSVGHGFVMHGQSPSWSSSLDSRSMGGHQRVFSSGAQMYRVNDSMNFLPGSMSPPSSLYRSANAGGMVLHSRSPSSFSQFSQQRTTPPAQAETIVRSPLLEEFRSRHNKSRQFGLSDIRGAVVEFSSDQHGSRFTQEKLDAATEEEVKLVFDELLPSSLVLMTDVFGNYVIQKLFEHGTPEMRAELVHQMQGHVLSLSLGTYGCRVVQKALDYSALKEQIKIADELKMDILSCVRDQNANHVVQKLLERVSPTNLIEFIPQAFRHKVFSLAAHCYSCRVLQRIFEFCDESHRRPLMDELLHDAERLMHDQYGNYVIQWALQNASKPDKEVIIQVAKGQVLRLSKHKFASNVIEQVIRAASQEERYSFIEEIMVPIEEENLPHGNSNEPTIGAVMMMRDQYGNYVLQRFLELSEGQQKIRLTSYIKPALNNMKRFSSGYSKHLSAIERLLDASVARNNAGTTTSDLPT